MFPFSTTISLIIALAIIAGVILAVRHFGDVDKPLFAFPTAEAVSSTPWPSIGGTFVPAELACAEDEIIGFTGPDTLVCIHVEHGIIGQ